MTKSNGELAPTRELISHCQRVSDVNWFRVANRATHDGGAVERHRLVLRQALEVAVTRLLVHRVILDDNYIHELGSADAGCMPGNRFEHWLHIPWRTCDDS